MDPSSWESQTESSSNQSRVRMERPLRRNLKLMKKKEKEMIRVSRVMSPIRLRLRFHQGS